MNKEAIHKIETDIKMNESDVSFLEVLILIFSITDIMWVIFIVLIVIQSSTSGFLACVICLIVFTSILCWVVSSFSEKIKKAAILIKAKWIATYWLDSKCNFDKSFFKHNYPSDNNKEAIEYMSTLIEKHIGEYAWGDE